MQLSGLVELEVGIDLKCALEEVSGLCGEENLLGANLELIIGNGKTIKVSVIDILKAKWNSLVDEDGNEKIASLGTDDPKQI